MRRFLSSVVLVGLLAGCGFELRGTQAVNALGVRAIYLVPTGEYRFDTQLARALTVQGGATVVTSAAGAGLTLDHLIPTQTRIQRAVDATGHAKEYELKYALSYRVLGADGVALLDDQVTVIRTMSYSDSLVLAKKQEEARIFEDMQRDAFSQLLRRLSRLNAAGNP